MREEQHRGVSTQLHLVDVQGPLASVNDNRSWLYTLMATPDPFDHTTDARSCHEADPKQFASTRLRSSRKLPEELQVLVGDCTERASPKYIDCDCVGICEQH